MLHIKSEANSRHVQHVWPNGSPRKKVASQAEECQTAVRHLMALELNMPGIRL